MFEAQPMPLLHDDRAPIVNGNGRPLFESIDSSWNPSLEHNQRLSDSNITPDAHSEDNCIHWLFEQQLLPRPDAPALVFEGDALSYHELNTRANRLAHYLQGLGVGPETLVGICIERSFEMIVAALGVLKAGGAYVPLDPTYPSERLSFMVADAQLRVLLVRQTDDHDHSPIDIGAVTATGAVAPIVVDLGRDWPRIAAQPGTNPMSSVTADNLAYVIYTSGSTGRPKGVLLHHRGLVNLVRGLGRAFDISSVSRVLQFASFSFDGSVFEIFTSLISGATLYLAPRDKLVSPPDLLEILRSQAITTAALPPSLLAVLPSADLPALSTVVSAGESCSWELALRWAAGRRFLNAYGPTETTVGPTCYLVEERVPDTHTVPIGRPLPNYQIYILDSHQQPVARGVPGEVYVGGVGLARGYLNRPELTAERFVELRVDALQAASSISRTSGASLRLYKTGDLARYLPDGNIEFLGRIDHQVKLRGFRIELGEIEAVLRQHPVVRDAVVVLREDLPREPRLVAYLTANELHATGVTRIDIRDLREFLGTKLASYMIPSAFVLLEALPVTVNGKVDRRDLPAPEADDAVSQGMAAPRAPEEAAIAAIWAEVLGRSSVGIYDDFFALGGHSLLAARAVTRISAALNHHIPLRALFEAPTVAALAQAIAGDGVRTPPSGPADLATEVVLDGAIVPPASVPASDAPPSAILLTGVTGYLGAFLLDELLAQTGATIYCLVRAPHVEEAARRIDQTLKRYGIWREAYSSRIVPVAGDLARPHLGLSTEDFNHLAATIDVIYHSGAQVHYLHPYETLRQANVHGTIEILRLACQERTKPIHYISTLAVTAGSRERVYEDDDLPRCTSPLGYVRSKWVAEKLIGLARERGIPIAVYRPGRIGCHSQTAVANPDDFFVRFVAGCIRLGMAPDVPMIENLVPVDYTARAIVHLSRQPALVNTTFHLTNPEPTPWSWVVEIARRFGYQLQLAPYSQWRGALAAATTVEPQDALHSLLMLMPEDPAAATWIDNWTKQSFDTRNTWTGLEGSGLACPTVDAPLIERMLADGVRRGLFDAPADADHVSYAPEMLTKRLIVSSLAPSVVNA